MSPVGLTPAFPLQDVCISALDWTSNSHTGSLLNVLAMTDNTLERHKVLIYLRLLATARGLNQTPAHDSDIRENST